MYIYKTTADERLTISENMGDIFPDISRARRLLVMVLDKFFDKDQPDQISSFDAGRIGDILNAVNDTLWTAELSYSLTVGDELAGGCEAYYEGARRAMLVRDVERLRAKLPGGAAFPYSELPDEEALPILQGIAEGLGGGTV